MSKSIPVIFVDGKMEKLILQKIGVSAKIITTNLNGRDVSINAIVQRISSSIRTLNGRYSPVIIIIDREDRVITADEIILELDSGFKINNISEEIFLGVADKMIENWILADWDSFKKNSHTNRIKSHPSFESLDGALIIKKYMPNYQKTIDGVNLFTKSKASSIKKNSPSFAKFFNRIEPLNCQCYWISQ